MKVIIDSHAADIEVDDKNVILQKLIEEVEAFLFSVGRVAVSLRIDGEDLTQEDLEKRALESLSDDSIIEFGACNILMHLVDMLKGALCANIDLAKKIEDATTELASVESPLWRELAEDLQNFFAFWNRICQLVPIEVSQLTVGETPFEEHLHQLLGLCQEIVTSMEAGDFVLAGDLLCYEIAPAVELLAEPMQQLIDVLQDKIDKEESQETDQKIDLKLDKLVKDTEV